MELSTAVFKLWRLLYEQFIPGQSKRNNNARFGRDTLIVLATVDGDIPNVRTVNSYYENGGFYVITYAKSNKMQQIE